MGKKPQWGGYRPPLPGEEGPGGALGAPSERTYADWFNTRRPQMTAAPAPVEMDPQQGYGKS